METISVLPNENQLVSMSLVLLENVISNVEQRRDENGTIEWGRRDAYALVAGALDCFKSLSAEKQEELIKHFEKYSN